MNGVGMILGGDEGLVGVPTRVGHEDLHANYKAFTHLV